MEQRKKYAIDVAEVCRRLGMSRSTVYKLVKKGKLPKPFKLGTRSSRWWDTEVDDFGDDSAAASRSAAPPAPIRKKTRITPSVPA